MYIWILIGKLGPTPGMALPQLPGETGCFLCNEEGFLQGSKEGLLTEAGVSEVPRRPAVPLKVFLVVWGRKGADDDTC